jgi:hypothetical protein
VTYSPSSPIWRAYRDISANAEADLARSSSGFSLSTLEIVSFPGVTGFALVEKMRHDLWRWATVSIEGPILEEGSNATQEEARRSAVEALLHQTTLT